MKLIPKSVVTFFNLLLCMSLVGIVVLAQDGGRTYTGPTRTNEPVKSAPPVKSPPSNNKLPKTKSPSHSEKPSSTGGAKPTLPVQLPVMVHIPGGTFSMGSNSRPNEQPVHNVDLEGFDIGIYEITNKEFEVFINNTGYKTDAERASSLVTWRSYNQEGRSNYPAVCVSWTDADKFCRWLSEATGENYRLPTEAEWEYAARGGLSNKNYPNGDELDDEHANFDEDGEKAMFNGVVLEYLSPVNSFSANGYGIYNMAGNVWEWCQDWYDEQYYQHTPSAHPEGPTEGRFKSMRGGGWVNSASFCRVSYRNYNSITFNMPYLGFRIVKTAN